VTREDAVAAIVDVTPLTRADLEGFLACTDEERAELVAAYRDAGKMPSASAWDVVIDVLKTCVELAGIVSPLVGVIQNVFAIAGAVK
jgi:hypothetical protein